jgi:hypothetical protein
MVFTVYTTQPEKVVEKTWGRRAYFDVFLSNTVYAYSEVMLRGVASINSQEKENEMDELPAQPAKHLFFDLCVMYKLDYQALQDIANTANVDKSIVGEMFVGVAVRRADAEKVLVAFSEYTSGTWDLNNVKVTLLN